MNFRDVLFGGSFEARPLADMGLALLRLFTGSALAFGHGLGKVQDPSKIISATEKIGFPLPTLFGYAATGAEFFGGLLLALGLLTRPAAFLVVCVMATAYFGVHRGDPFKAQELVLFYGFAALAFLLAGGGRYSFDALIRGKRGR